MPQIGVVRWGTLATYSVPGNTSLYYVNEEFADGPYVLDLAIGAGSEGLAKAFAHKTALGLDRRLRLAIAGRLHGHPAKLPGPPRTGPPASGPDPASLVLTPSDLPSSKVAQEGYDWAPLALSTHDVEFSPATRSTTSFRPPACCPLPRARSTAPPLTEPSGSPAILSSRAPHTPR